MRQPALFPHVVHQGLGALASILPLMQRSVHTLESQRPQQAVLNDVQTKLTGPETAAIRLRYEIVTVEGAT